MKERRYQGGLPSISQIWTGIWLALLAFFLVLWVTDAPARDYGYSYDRGSYSGWHSDMLEEERRQTRIMRRQEQRELDREIQREYEENRGNWRRYQENLRRGVW